MLLVLLLFGYYFEYSCSFPSLDFNIDTSGINKGRGIFNFIYSKGNWEEVSKNGHASKRGNSVTKNVFKNVACLNQNENMIETFCCSDGRKSDLFFEIPTETKIPCDEPNCKETCYLIWTIHNRGLNSNYNQNMLHGTKEKKQKLENKSLKFISESSSEGKKTTSSKQYDSKFAEAVQKLMELYKTMNELKIEQLKSPKILNLSHSTEQPLASDNSQNFSLLRADDYYPLDFYDEGENLDLKSTRAPNSDDEIRMLLEPLFVSSTCPVPSENIFFEAVTFSQLNCSAREQSNNSKDNVKTYSTTTESYTLCNHSTLQTTSNCTLQTTSNCTTDYFAGLKAEWFKNLSIDNGGEKSSSKRPAIPDLYNQEGELFGESRSVPESNGLSKTEETVAEYIDYLSSQTESVYKRFIDAKWAYETNMNHQSRKKSMITSLELTQYQRKLNKALSSIKNVPIRDPLLKRKIKRLFLPGMSTLPDLKIAEFEQVIFAMKTIYTTATVAKWNHLSQKISLQPVISDSMAKSKDPEERQYYWLEWRKVTGRRIRSLFEQYVELVNQAAMYNGLPNGADMWTRYYETEDFIQLLVAYLDEIQPLYKQLHSHVRHKLHQRYGDITNATDDGLIPVHLTGDIWGEDWRHLYDIVKPYPLQKDLFKDDLENHKYSTQTMLTDIEKMFNSLGFKTLPKEFWKKSKFIKKNTLSPGCKSSAWDMVNGSDFRIKFCSQNKIDDFFEMHKYLALVHYFSEYNSQPFPFREPANPAFGYALSGAILLSTRSSTHFDSLGLTKSKLRAKADQKQQDLNFLMHEALRTIAGLPYSYILDLWRVKVFDGSISSSEYNKNWWEMRGRYQGVAPPVERTEEDFDVGSKYEVVANEPYIRHFLSKILAFQFHEALCNKANHQGPLYKCDISKSTKAGQAIRKVMSKGSSQHWRMSVKELTGKRKISSQPLLRYFQPLHQWLKERNSIDQQRIGWERSLK